MNETAFRRTEAELWRSYGLAPSECFITLPRIGTRVRVVEVGEGDPVLCIHGSPNAGATWAPMLPHLTGFRALLLDRPGSGLSEPVLLEVADLPHFAERLVGDVLDGLGLDSAHVVASSFGGHVALRSAASEPDRFRRMVQMGCPALVPGDRYPPFMKVLTIGWLRRLIGLLPPSERVNRNILRQIGHGASLDADRIPQAFMDWYLALGRHTDTMRIEGEMIGRIIPLLESHPELRLGLDLFAEVKVPTLFFWGADDTFGDETVARRIVEAMPDAALVMVPDAGHLPWLDDPRQAGHLTAEFLRTA